MAEPQQKLAGLRDRIDALDGRIVKLLNERAEVVIEIGQSKRASGGTTYVPDREREVLDRLAELNKGPLPQQTVVAIYRELMSGSFALERAPRIAYLGPAGSYSHLAATRKFGSSVEYEAVGHIAAVFDEVERDRVDLGLVPVENSTGGGVVDTLDSFASREVTICVEMNLAVHHHLLGRGAFEQIKAVYSKPEALGQCQRWLVETGLLTKAVPVASTSKAAEIAANDPTAAAIGSKLAGELYGLAVLSDRIEDDPNNITRFLVVSKTPAKPTGDDKTAIYFNAADKPGALAEVLEVFRKAGINMTFIESRPSRTKAFDYGFFIDLLGHIETPNVAQAIEAARKHCLRLKILGSFPRAVDVL